MLRDEDRRRVLDTLLQRLDHRGSVVAVDEPMIERRGQIHHAAHSDGAANDHRPLNGAIDADDGNPVLREPNRPKMPK